MPIGANRAGIVSQVGDEIPDSGISRFEFEQDYTDSWGENDGSAVGSPTITTDSQVGNYAVGLDGNDDAVDQPHKPETAEVSIAMWVKFRTDSERDTTDQYLFAARDNDNDFIEFGWDADGIVWHASGNNGISQTQSWSELRDLNWHMVAAVYDGSDYVVYTDDTETQRKTGPYSPTLNIAPSIGAVNQEGSYDRLSDVIVDDVRIYDKGLTATEVSDLYNTG
jgi:hypothetical protein